MKKPKKYYLINSISHRMRGEVWVGTVGWFYIMFDTRIRAVRFLKEHPQGEAIIEKVEVHTIKDKRIK